MSLIKKIFRFGVKRGDDLYTSRLKIAINILALNATFCILVAIGLGSLVDGDQDIIYALFGIPVYAAVFYFNYKDQVQWSITLMFVTGALMIAMFSLRAGEDSMLHMLFVLNIIGLALLYRKGRLRFFYWLNIGFTLSCFVFVFFAFRFDWFIDFRAIEVDALFDRRVHVMFLVFCAVVFSVVSVSSFSQQYRRLQRTVDEKDVLLAELNHRVKNNLSIIVSLLRLKQGVTENEETRESLREIGNRIHSMALVHHQMYQGKGRSFIEVSSYFDELMAGICDSLGEHPNIHCKKDIDDVSVGVTTAIPLGMILNELIMNAIKHAFVDIANPSIEISFHQKENSFELIFRDNGIGMDESEANLGESLGLELIHSLSEQLDGNCEYHNDNGLVFRVEFPLFPDLK